MLQSSAGHSRFMARILAATTGFGHRPVVTPIQALRAASWMKASTASMPLLRVGDKCLPNPISVT
jgi:hypothetical protein